MIIDFHTHVYPPAVKNDRESYLAKDPGFAELYSNPKAKIITADELISAMDESEIEVSIINGFSWGTTELCRENNDYLLESVARFPKRLIGFCSIPPADTARAEIERCARGGARGIGELRPDRHRQSLDFTSREKMVPIVETLQKHRMILLTHASEPVGHEYAGKGKVTPDILYPLILNFPDLTIVCAHWGGGLPFYALMPEVKEAMKNVFFDTAASPFLYTPRIYHHVIGLVGADKILFGSDYPLMPPKRLIEEIESLNLPENERKLILSGNALRLLSMEAGRR